MRRPSVLGIAGSVRQPSRTTNLVAAVVDAIAGRLGTTGDRRTGRQGGIIPRRAQRDAIHGRALEIVEAIEDADVLVVGTPVYRASYTGLFKHVFDLIHHEALVGKAVVLTATGGSPLHGLVMEHQLRPLFGFFRAHTMPSAVYATEADFDQYKLTSPIVSERVERAAEEVARLHARRADASPGPRRRQPRRRRVIGATRSGAETMSNVHPYPGAYAPERRDQVRLLGPERLGRPRGQQDRAAHRLGHRIQRKLAQIAEARASTMRSARSATWPATAPTTSTNRLASAWRCCSPPSG